MIHVPRINKKTPKREEKKIKNNYSLELERKRKEAALTQQYIQVCKCAK